MRITRALVAAGALALAAAALAGGPHVLKGKGSSGWIKYWGNGTVQLSGRGTLTIKNQSNVTLDVDGTWGETEKITDGVVYTHFKGTVKAVGLGAHVEIRGWDLEIYAKGQGKAHFQGVGTASLDGGPEEPWPQDQTHNGWLKLNFRD